MDRRLYNLRRKLNQYGYNQFFSTDGIDLVEKLLTDLIQTKNSKFGSNNIRVSNSNVVSKENSDCQKDLSKIKTDYEKKLKTLNDDVLKLESENTDLHFLNDQYAHKIQQLEEETKNKSDRLHELLEKNLHASIHITGDTSSSVFKNQRLEIDSLVPSATQVQQQNKEESSKEKPSRTYVDLLKKAEEKAARLQAEKDDCKKRLSGASALIASLKEQIELKDLEKDKLTKMFKNNHALHHENIHPCGDHLVAHLTFEMEHLQRLNYDLEKRLKDVLNSEKEVLCNKHKQLVTQNEQLELNLADTEKMFDALKKQKEELLVVADKELNGAKEEIKLLHDKITKFDQENINLKKENELLSVASCELKETISNLNSKLKTFEMTVTQLEEEKNKILNGLRKPEDERMAKGMDNENSLANIIKSVENQRDFYKRHLESLSAPSQHLRNVDDPLTSTPLHRTADRITENNLYIQWNPLISFIEEERDLYKKEYENVKSAELRLTEDKSDNNIVAELQSKLETAIEKNKQFSKTLATMEKKVQEINESAKDLAGEKNALQVLYDKVLAAYQQQKAKAGQKLVVPNINEGLIKLQAERDKAYIELEVLRNKLKLATETQISERKRLENRINDLEVLQTLVGDEKAELVSKVTVSEFEILNLNETLKLLKSRIIELEEKFVADKSKLEYINRNLSEKAIKDKEQILIEKASERSSVDAKIRDLENEIEILKDVIDRRNREIAELKLSIRVLDRDRDKFLTDVDLKTERIVSLESDLKSKVKHVIELQQKLGNSETQIQGLTDIILRKDKEMLSLKRELDQNRGEVEDVRKICDETILKYNKLQEEFTLFTENNKELQRNIQKDESEKELLKRTVQEYINEVSRVEGILRATDQERADLLGQLANLTSTTSSLEYQNYNLESLANNSKKELQDRELQLSRSKEIIADLNQEIEDYYLRNQKYEQELVSCRRSLDDLKMELQLAVQEKDRLQREMMALRDLNVKLSIDKDNLSRDMRNKDEEITKLEVNMVELRQKIDSLTIQTAAEKSAVKNLEKLLATNRQKEYETLLSNREISDQMALVKENLLQTESRLHELTIESLQHKTRAEDLQKEIDLLKRQLTDARFDREKLNQEVKRIRHVSPTYVVTTTVTETKTTSDNPFIATKANNEQ